MTLKAGAARVIVTPPVGVELSGYAFGPSVGILDDLEAQALVMESAGGRAVFVTADLIGFCPELIAGVRRRVEASLGIPGHRVLLAASHTHSGPATVFLRHWGAFDEVYLRSLESQLVGLVAMAQNNLEEACVGMGMGHVDHISENRGVAHGLIDPAVPVLRFDSLTGHPIAVFYNYACHPVSLHNYKNLVTPDYPGYARSVVRDVLDQDVVVMFILGAAGDINPRGFVPGQTTPQRSRQIGAILGCEVAKIALGLHPQSEVTLRVERTVVNLPVEPLPPPSELRAMRDQFEAEAVKRGAEGQPLSDVAEAEIRRDWASEALREWESGKVQRSRACEMQGIRLGDAVVVGLPLEVFVETGLAIKQAFPTTLIFISSNSNGALGYLPTKDDYEVEQHYTNPQGLAPKVYDLYAFSPEAEPLARREVVQLIEALRA